jgi:hypothetical protein
MLYSRTWCTLALRLIARGTGPGKCERGEMLNIFSLEWLTLYIQRCLTRACQC